MSATDSTQEPNYGCSEPLETAIKKARTDHQSRERRYALLQASATIFAGGIYLLEGENEPRSWESYESAVNIAEQLLAEIEKRESAAVSPAVTPAGPQTEKETE